MKRGGGSPGAPVDFYSVPLSLSLVAAVASLALALAGRLAGRARSAPAWTRGRLRGLSLAAGVAALVLVTGSTVFHWLTGHRPGSPGALSPGAFFGEHPAFVTVAGVATAALFLLRTGKPVTGGVEGKRGA